MFKIADLDFIKDHLNFKNINEEPLKLVNGEGVVCDVVSLFHTTALHEGKINKKKLLNEVLDKYRDLYETTDDERAVYYENLIRTILDKEDPDFFNKLMNYFDILDEYYFVFSNSLNRKILIEAADVHLKIMGYSQELNCDDCQLVDNSHEDFVILFRRLIAVIPFKNSDIFGNQQFLDGSPIFTALDAGIVFNGLLKAVSGTENYEIRLKRLNQFRCFHTHLGQFLNYFFNYVGLIYSAESNCITLISSPQFRFYLSFINWITPLVSLNYSSYLKNDSYFPFHSKWNTATKDQFTRWTNAYIDIYLNESLSLSPEKRKAFKSERVTSLQDLETYLHASEDITDEELETASLELSNDIKSNIGMALSPMYIKYSIASAKTNKTPLQQELVDVFMDVNPINRENISEINITLGKLEHPFFRLIDTVEKRNLNYWENINEDEIEHPCGNYVGGNIYRLKVMAESNNIFDETVTPISYTYGNYLKYSYPHFRL